MARLNGKVALVTGAGSGIGRGIAQVLAREGATAVTLSRTAAHAEETASAIRQAGGEALAIAADVRLRVDVERAVAAALEAYGQLDCVVNNAGVNVCSPILDLQEEDWDRVFDVNVKGIYLTTRAALPNMVARRQGRIVNIASWVGRNPLPRFAHYSASKAAVIALTRGLALEVAEHGITVNAVLPGNVWSNIWPGVLADYARLTGTPEEECLKEFVQGMPFKRMQTVEDIAASVVFLLSDEAREITGEALGVTGGL
jgi:NAD(P)-dependent dehydrogenase (short-subunit alcohol dehydrogenase family)